MSLKDHLRDFRRRYLTAMFLAKATLISLNSSFILLDLLVSTLLWLDLARLPGIVVDLPPETMASILATKRCGILLTSLLVISIASLGLAGALKTNSSLLITYDVAGLLAAIVLLLGWQNYQDYPLLYGLVLGAIFVALIVGLLYIKAIKEEPYRIRRQLMMVNMANMRESICVN